MTRGATTRPPAFERRLRASIALRKAAVELGRAYGSVPVSALTGKVDGRRTRRHRPREWARIVAARAKFGAALDRYAALYRKALR